MKNRIIPLAGIALFLALLVLPTVLYLTVGEDTANLLNEKRKPVPFPTAVSDGVLGEVDAWYSDHAPYRLSLVTLQKRAAQAYGVPYRERLHPVLSARLVPGWYRGETPYLAPIEQSNVLYGREGWLYYSNKGSIDYYTGANPLPEADMQAWKVSFLRLKAACEARGIRLVVAVAPNKEQVYPEYLPSLYIHSAVKREDAVAETMRAAGIPYLWLLPDLLAAKAQYPVLYRMQDTHWNGLGGYIGAMAMLREAGLPTADLSEWTVTPVERTGGDLSNFVGYATPYSEYRVAYKPGVALTREDYKDGNISVYTSDADTDRKLVLVGDSFRTACADILTRNFKTSVLLHRSRVTNKLVTKAVRALGDGDVLILMSLERYDAYNYGLADTLAGLLEAA